MACRLYLHPLAISTAQQFFFIYIAGFTSRTSILRPIRFIIFLISTFIALAMFEDFIEPPGWVSRLIISAFPQISLTYFEPMMVRKIAYAEDREKKGQEPQSTIAEFRKRYVFGQQVASSMRGLGTPWEIRNIHHFDSQDPTYVPAATPFVCINLLKVLLCYFVHKMCITTQLSLDQQYLAPNYVSIFRRVSEVSLVELQVRYMATVTTVVSIFCFIQGGYSLASAASVTMNPKAVKDWRPIFGELTESYCLRQFWSAFWHQGQQNNLRGIKSYSLPSRYLKILLAFALSGLVQVLSDMVSAVSAKDSGAIQFFGRDKEYLKDSLAFADLFILNSGLLIYTPSILKPLLGFLPLYEERAKKLLNPGLYVKCEEPTDNLQMMMRYAISKHGAQVSPPQISDRLCLANLALFHQTAVAISNVLINIAASDAEFNTIAVIRKEMEDVLVESNDVFDKASVSKMIQTDSILRESMRTHGFGNRAMIRKVIAPGGIKTPDGHTLPNGSTMSILSYPVHQDLDIYEHPEKFCPFRFSNTRTGPDGKDTNPTLSFVSTSSTYLPFGHGKHACPGRFLVDFEMKMILYHILNRFDIELLPEHNGVRPESQWVTEAVMPPVGFKLRFKKREAAYYDYVKPHLLHAMVGKILGYGLLLSEGDVHKRLTLLTGRAEPLEIIGSAGMGHECKPLADPSIEDTMKMYGSMVKQSRGATLLTVLQLVLPSIITDYLSFQRNMGVLAASKAARETSQRLINAKKVQMAAKEKLSTDIISTALESAAGHETSAAALTWTIFLLARNHDIQDRLREQIRQNVDGLTDYVDAKKLDNLSYLHAVCQESLRLYAPIHFTVRDALKDTQILGTFVPKGTMVILCPWAINRAHELWGPDADDFNPERWMTPGQANSGGAKNNYAFLTFLHGPRGCIGQKFSLAELMALTCALVGRYRFYIDKDYEAFRMPTAMSPAGIVFCLIFAATGIYHIVSSFQKRKATSYLLAISSYIELIGWIGRTWSSKCAYNKITFLLQITTLVVAPIFVAAAIYVTLGYLIEAAGGGGLASGAANKGKDTKPGANLMVAGIIFQLVRMTGFCILFAIFVLRTRGLELAKGQRFVIYATIISVVFVYIRCIY
ncbi:TRI7-trichothecene biosynthesis [Fusarium agapanthi]|uniref:TRI7-trichothecene biosynthesis n=1 Tax=Fusarium agapanthi TaxID=1803897 RepID=A0A9P5B5R3_9HYPO|nr:TRI7-trichothecene biosynthesis [Fusarium agapanthi]